MWVNFGQSWFLDPLELDPVYNFNWMNARQAQEKNNTWLTYNHPQPLLTKLKQFSLCCVLKVLFMRRGDTYLKKAPKHMVYKKAIQYKDSELSLSPLLCYTEKWCNMFTRIHFIIEELISKIFSLTFIIDNPQWSRDYNHTVDSVKNKIKLWTVQTHKTYKWIIKMLINWNWVMHIYLNKSV